MTAPESQNPQPAEPPPLGYSTLPVPDPVDLAAVLHRQDTRPAASLSTAQLRDGADHQTAPGGANR